MSSSYRGCFRILAVATITIAVAFFILPSLVVYAPWTGALQSYNPSPNFKSLSTRSLAQLVSSIGPDYARYASRVAADSVTGATVEFIFQHNTKYGVDKLLQDLGATQYSHRAVLKQKIDEWRHTFRLLDGKGVERFLSQLDGADAVPTAEPNAQAAERKEQADASQCNRMSVSGFQAELLFQIVEKHAAVCPAAATTDADSIGIPPAQAEWYESAHEDGLKRAAESRDSVSDTAVGNGWEYSDDDVLGMVAPLRLHAHDSVLDVGCGDGYFLERVLRLLHRLELRGMGVDLMPFMINTARARFIRLALEFFDSKSNCSMRRDADAAAPCTGTSCAIKSFPVACVGSGLDMRWIQSGSFNKYISVYPINHFDDQGSEKLICEAHRVLAPGGVAFFGMINRDEGTFLGPYFRNESWWAPVARRCGFESVVTSSEFTEWRGGPARYHAYLKKGKVASRNRKKSKLIK